MSRRHAVTVTASRRPRLASPPAAGAPAAGAAAGAGAADVLLAALTVSVAGAPRSASSGGDCALRIATAEGAVFLSVPLRPADGDAPTVQQSVQALARQEGVAAAAAARSAAAAAAAAADAAEAQRAVADAQRLAEARELAALARGAELVAAKKRMLAEQAEALTEARAALARETERAEQAEREAASIGTAALSAKIKVRGGAERCRSRRYARACALTLLPSFLQPSVAARDDERRRQWRRRRRRGRCGRRA